MPIIPAGATPINNFVSVERNGADCVYFLGVHPIFQHLVGEHRLFLFAIAQLIDTGSCRPCEIIKTFGVSKSSVDRALRAYRQEGIDAFASPGKRRATGKIGGGRVLTAQILEQAQELLASGMSKAAAADELGIGRDTFRRAVWDGRLRENQAEAPSVGTDKSERSLQDAEAAEGLGTACTRGGERMLAALGAINGATTQFEHCRGVSYGGVLCALGALLSNGLLGPSKELLGKVSGYYTTAHILLLLAYMALCRIKTVEQLRGKPPGELGHLMGLDRVPEVRCLRAKLDALSREGAAEKWMAALSNHWMREESEAVGTLYVDGHVRVYHGSKTALPRKYVSRQRLCLRGTTDYWVNDHSGLPFFVVDKVVDPGLIQVLEQEIVPRLLREVPNQPTQAELTADPYRSRFVLVFDREGYSPGLFKRLWQEHRVSCISYHKHPSENWPESEFLERTVAMSNGESVTMKLAEKGSLIGSGKEAVWMKEVRKRTDEGHQVSIITTAYGLGESVLSGRLFSRWCQENFFRYMMQHFAIDLLSEYKNKPLHDTARVVNPAWRQWERQRNSLQSKLRYRRARFAEWTLHTIPASEPEKYEKREKQKALLLEEIQKLESDLNKVVAERNQTPNHILWKDLPKEDQFLQPVLDRKRLIDAVRMIAYRAETAMCVLLTSPTSDTIAVDTAAADTAVVDTAVVDTAVVDTAVVDTAVVDTAAARRVLQDLFVTEADLRPDPAAGILHVDVHRGSRPKVDRILSGLFSKLNDMEFKFPGTELQLHYQLLGDDSAAPDEPASLEVPGSKEF